MKRSYDKAAYAAGQQAVIDPNVDFEAEAMRRARAYLISHSLDGTEEAVHVLWSFLKGAYDARQTYDDQHTIA